MILLQRSFRNFRPLFIRIALAFMLIPFCTQISAADWKPVDDQLLSNRIPTVDKNADAEFVFWEMRITYDANRQAEFENYVRLKIFNERGIEYANKVDILYDNRIKVKNIKGRTIKPDGSVVKLKNNSIFDRTLISIENYELKAKTLAMPSVEPGAVVEYQWKEIRPTDRLERYYLQGIIPIQSLSLYLKPPKDLGFSRGMIALPCNLPGVELQKDKKEYYRIILENIPAFRVEPLMPPEDSVRPYLLVYFTRAPVDTNYWSYIGKLNYNASIKKIASADIIKKKTAEIIGNNQQPAVIIEKLFHFFRSEMINLNDDATDLPPEQLKKYVEDKSISNILELGMGTSADILTLFASMATAAGLDARIAYSSDRSKLIFSPEFTDFSFLNRTNVAIKVNDDWKVYNPVAAYLPLGMLPWEEEGTLVLIPDPETPKFLRTPLSPAQKSCKKRTAVFRLTEDGTLEGDVVLEFTGHEGAERKEYLDEIPPEKQEEIIRQSISGWINSMEITEVNFENISDRDKPLIHRFHARVPNYGQKSGSRLFFQPFFFQKGVEPYFPDRERTHDISFHYPWSEIDEIEIRLPEGYELEGQETHRKADIGDVSKYDLQINPSENGRILRCLRNFFFGKKTRILFKNNDYPTLKLHFDTVYDADNYIVSLNKTTAN